MYCSHCFEAGRFTLPDLSAQEMQVRVKGKLEQLGLRLRRVAIHANIPKLARWKDSGSTFSRSSLSPPQSRRSNNDPGRRCQPETQQGVLLILRQFSPVTGFAGRVGLRK